MRSTSREHKHSNASSFQNQGGADSHREMQQQIELNYIGLRTNKAHVMCQHDHNPSMRSNLPPQPQQVNTDYLMKKMNSELQRFIDSDLMMALDSIKKDMMNNQFNFERQMCSVILQMQKDLENHQVQPQKKEEIVVINQDYATKQELKEQETFILKLIEELDDNFNDFQFKQSQVVVEHSGKIENLNYNIQEHKNESLLLINGLQKQIQEIQQTNQEFQKRLFTQDGKFDSQNIKIDSFKDDLEKVIRNVKDELRKQISDIEDRLNDYELRNEEDHETFRLSIKKLQESSTGNIKDKDIEDLRVLIRKLESSQNFQEIQELRERIDEHQEVIENFEINEIREQIQQIELQLKKQDWSKDIQILKETQQTHLNSIEELRDANNSNQDNIQEVAEKTDQNTKEIDELRDKIEHLSATINFYKDIKIQNEDSTDIEAVLNQYKVLFDDQLEALKKKVQTLDEKVDSNNKRLDEKIDSNIKKVDVKIDNQIKRVDEKIDTNHKSLDQKVDKNVKRIDEKDQEQDQRLDKLEKQFSLQEKDINIYKKQMNKQFKDLNEAIMKEFELIEDKVFNALKQDILKQVNVNVQNKVYEPLVKRIEALEKNQDLVKQDIQAERETIIEMISQMQVVPPEDKENEQPPVQKTLKSKQEIMHERLLSEMKRKRSWYLRKTPQDYIIEEIMLAHRCSQEQAEKIYLQQLEEKKMLRTPSGSPNRQSKFEGSKMKGINENIIHATSSSKGLDYNIDNQLRSQSRQIGVRGGQEGQTNNFLGFDLRSQGNTRVKSAREEGIMRRPQSNNFNVEADYEQANSINSNTPSKKGSPAPYIVIKSPLHETVEKRYVSKTTKQVRVEVTDVNDVRNASKFEERKNRFDDDDDFDDIDNLSVDESNLDTKELDGDNDQMRENLSILKSHQKQNSNAQSLIERPRSESYFKKKEDSGDKSYYMPSERQSNQNIKSNPFSLVKEPQPVREFDRTGNVRSFLNENISNIHEVQQDYSIEEIKQAREQIANKYEEDEKEKSDFQDIDDLQSHNNSQDFEYEGSKVYDYQENIIHPDISQTSIKKDRNSSMGQ